MPAELSTPQVAPFAVTRHWSSQLDDQATTAQSLLGPPATFKDNPGPAYIWRSDDRDRNIGALQLLRAHPVSPSTPHPVRHNHFLLDCAGGRRHT